MIESTDEIYENIADNIRKGITEPWDMAELTIRIGSKGPSYDGYYVHGDRHGFIEISAFNRTLDDDMNKLHDLTTRGHHNAIDDWNEAVFTLHKEGHYEMRFLPKTD